ncbi:MAG: DNA polymerase III subunit delta' C-terminal domain-containing protein [Candidatus Firestonebacteria bacterium]
MLENIVGHYKQKKILASSFKNNRMAHAYLFLGKEGVGKKALAVEFARLVNCEHPDFDDFRSCAVCDSCEKQTKNLNPDIAIVEQEGATIKKLQVKTLLEEQSLSSYYNKYKFVIINNAERLTKDAVPMLLKTIEEPMKKRVFILVASNPYFILPTVKSRCQVIKFGVLTREQVRDILIFNSSVKEDIAEYAARASEGSAARALELIEEKNLELRELIFQMLESYYSVKQLFDLKTIKSKFEKFSIMVTDFLESFFYDVFKMKTGKGLIYNSDKESLIKKYSLLLPLENVSNIIKELDSYRSLISRNLSMNQDLVINSILVKGDIRNG